MPPRVPITTRPGVPIPITLTAAPAGLTGVVRAATEKRARARLGLQPAEPLPAEVADAIKKASEFAATNALKTSIEKDAQSALEGVEQAAAFDRFLQRAATAKTGITTIAGSQDVKEILKKRAEMLSSKVQALEAAGFSRDEAMRVLLADIAARA
jgi:hypothetical protein